MRRGRWALLLLLLWPGLPAAQIGASLVYDPFNEFVNTLNWVETTFVVANQVLDLTPVDEVVLSGEFASSLDSLSVIVAESVGLAYDLESLNAQIRVLFDVETAPDNMTDLKQRLTEIRQLSHDCHVYALRTQTLIQTTLSAVQHLLRLIDAVGGLVGNMQGNQVSVQVTGTLTELVAKMQVQTAAFARSQSVDQITELMTLASLHKIQEAIMADHPAR